MRHLMGVWARATAGNPRAAAPPATALKRPRREVGVGGLGFASVVMPVFPSLGARAPRCAKPTKTCEDAGIIGPRWPTCQESARALTARDPPDSIHRVAKRAACPTRVNAASGPPVRSRK